MQLRNAILIIADTLCTNPNDLSYDTIKLYGDVFCNFANRWRSAAIFGNFALLSNTAEFFLSSYAFLGSLDNAKTIIREFQDLM